MNIKNYLRDIKINITLVVFIMIIVNVNIILDSNLSKTIGSLAYINGLIIIICIFFLLIGYYNYYKKYNEFLNYISNKAKTTNFNNGIYEAVDEKMYQYEEEIEKLKYELKEINDYMTNWIHQVKIPIAVIEILSQKIKDIESSSLIQRRNSIYKEINIELKRIENLVQQALYISRSGDYSIDFIIEEVNLERVVKEVIRKNKHLFIYNKIKINIYDLDKIVLTDKKWITHIIEQIVDNALKYTKHNGEIKIYTTKDEKGIKLHIKDDGIGIETQDIERIFDKGFTGKNGRKTTKSTGMGLYICKKILNKLSHDIGVESQADKFCDIYITFYNLSDYFNVT